MNKIPLPCLDCNLPFGYIQKGQIVVESRHHGEKHRNTISLRELIRLLQLQEQEQERRPELIEGSDKQKA